MGSIMLAWKKNNSLLQVITALACFLLLVVWPNLSYSNIATGINIEKANGSFDGDKYSVGARIIFQFSKETRKALEQGVALYFDINIDAKESRTWLWDKTVATFTISYQLEHHPLSGHYLVTNLNNYQRKHFQNLPGALDYLGKIENLPLFIREDILPDRVYIGRMRARLNIQKLPAPLRPLAYLSSKWRMSSQWYKWVIKQ